jgi:WD40 repeat protein
MNVFCPFGQWHRSSMIAGETTMRRIGFAARTLRGVAVGVAALFVPTFASAQFGDVGGGAGGGDWKVVADPPSIPLTSTVKDLAIPIPQGFGQGAEARFPSTPSPFVAVGKNGWDNDIREIWDLRTKTKVGTMRGKADYGKTTALSPDGMLIAGKPGFRDAIEIRSTKVGKLVQTIDPIPAWCEFVDFGQKDQIIAGKPQDKLLRVWSIKSGDPLFDLHFNSPVEPKAIAFSPGRRYLASFGKDDSTLRIHDLADGGKTVGEQIVAKGDGEAFNPNCLGIAFSNDGADLAAVFESFGKVRIVAWSVAGGKQTADFTADLKATDKIAVPAFYEDKGIQWLPDKSGWLAFGSSIVDRESGRKVWNLPYDSQNFTISPRRLIDNGRALVVVNGGKVLRIAPVPADKVQAAAKLARSGGNAADALLPPLKPVDLSGAKMINLATTPGAWSVAVDAAPPVKRLSSRPIALKTKLSEVISVLISGPETAQVLVAGCPSAFGKPDTAEGIQRWADRYDLASGRHLGRIEIAPVSDLISFSPDATRLLVREIKTKDRLDVYGVDGKPVVGWRPYDKETGEGRTITFAQFLDANRVATLSATGRLVVWSLPQVKALYVVDDAFHGTPVLSPNRTTLAGFAADTIRFVDAATGTLKGEAAGPAVSVGSRIDLNASAFRGDGGEWAGIFSNGQLIRIDVRTGKTVGEFRSPVLASSLEYGAAGYLLADGKNLIDLTTRRAFWAYNSGASADRTPDGRHWFTCAFMPESPAMLAAVLLPEKGMEKMLAMMTDEGTPAIVRPGSKVSLQLEFNGPPRKADEFRKAVYDMTAAKLQGAGLDVSPGQAVTFLIRVTEKNTGETLKMQKIGFNSAPGGPFNQANLLSIPIIDLQCSLDVVGAVGNVPCATTVLGLRTFFHVLHLPAGETDVEKYLKDRQWDGLKHWLETTSMPYFVAKSGPDVVRLPGFTDLNQLYGRSQ